MKRSLSVLLVVPAIFALSACDNSLDAACGSSSCHLDVVSGGKVTIAGQEFSVSDVSQNSVTLAGHGVKLVVSRGLDVSFAGYRLHLEGTRGASASLEMTSRS